MGSATHNDRATQAPSLFWPQYHFVVYRRRRRLEMIRTTSRIKEKTNENELGAGPRLE